MRLAPSRATVPWVLLMSLTQLQTRSEQEWHCWLQASPGSCSITVGGKGGCDGGRDEKADVSPSLWLAPNRVADDFGNSWFHAHALGCSVKGFAL